MCVSLIEHGRELVTKKPCISFVIAGPTTSQLDWKKLAEKPSGPGALSGCIANMASRISKADGIDVRREFVSTDIHGEIADKMTSLGETPVEVKIF